jgi:hypothetical protein
MNSPFLPEYPKKEGNHSHMRLKKEGGEALKRPEGVVLRCFLKKAVFIIAVLLAACRSEEQLQLSEEQIARIMADLHIAEAATSGLVGYQKDSLLYCYYEQIFTLHQVDRQTYERDLRLLAREEARMQAVVERAEELLQASDDAF